MMVDQRPLRKSLLGIGGPRWLRLYLLRAQGATLQHPGWLSNQVWLYAVPTKGRLHGRRAPRLFCSRSRPLCALRYRTQCPEFASGFGVLRRVVNPSDIQG